MNAQKVMRNHVDLNIQIIFLHKELIEVSIVGLNRPQN
jgi:hypothetical protein